MSYIRLLLFLLITFSSQHCEAQSDSAVQQLQQLPLKCINQVNSKIDKYSNRITNKTEKTLTKLSKWENKIHNLLLKLNPAAAENLFGNNQTTFSSLLQKIQEGKTIAENYQAKYDAYRDKLTTSISYLQQQKDSLKTTLVNPLNEASQKLTTLEDHVKNSEALEQFIKQRKKQLIDQSLQYIGNSKYLQKISKESYYYVATIKNYKEIFSDKKKAEETALTILNKIPAFTKFIQQNSMLARLFGAPSGGASTASLAGLQTRASVNTLIQNQIAAGGPNAQQQITQHIQQAQSELSKLKDKIIKAGAGSSDAALPDFKPNEQKTKTFKQRIEFGSNIQFAKNNVFVPTTADIGVSLGYKPNDKSVIGLGASYKMGMGSIEHISITHQGIGLRSFADWKLKKQFFISGGYEMNYNAAFKNIQQLQNYGGWQQAGLVGLSKKINIKTKWFKETKLQLLYDMLARQHVPVSQPVIFRTGYNF